MKVYCKSVSQRCIPKVYHEGCITRGVSQRVYHKGCIMKGVSGKHIMKGVS